MQPARAVRLLLAAVAVAFVAALPAQARPALDTSSVVLTSSAANPAHGQLVTFTATVSGSGACAPATGENVAFTIDGAAVATAQITASGLATYATSVLTPGQHTVVALYNGDANCAAATATLQVQVANSGATRTLLSALTFGPATSSAVAFSAVVIGLATPCFTPTGSVSFLEATGGVSLLLGSAPLSTTQPDQALFIYTGAAAGAQTVIASYAGDANCAPSISASASVIGGGAGASPGSAPITILTGVGSPATQVLHAGCTAVSVSTLAGTPVAALASLVNPLGGLVTGIWRYDYATQRYLAGYLAASGAPLDFVATNGGQETFSICTSTGGTVRSSA